VRILPYRTSALAATETAAEIATLGVKYAMAETSLTGPLRLQWWTRPHKSLASSTYL
jgi:hypothetical protein